MEGKLQAALQIIFALIVAGIILYFSSYIQQFEGYGYLGVFLISLFSAATIFVPLPGWGIVLAMGAILNPFIVGIIAGIGSALGEFTGYFFGKGVTELTLEKQKMLGKYRKWMVRNDMLAIFVFAFLPNPFFDLAGLAAGAANMPKREFFVACAAGRMLRYVIFGYLGAALFA